MNRAPFQYASASLRAVLTHAPVVLFVLDADGVFAVSEGKGLKALGLAPGAVVGTSVFELYKDVPQLIACAKQALAGEEFTCSVEVLGRWYETHYAPMHDPTGTRMGVIGVSVDITERKGLEAQLMFADRMGAIGALATGMAHEINNPLAYAMLGIELISSEVRKVLDGERDVSEGLSLIEETVRSVHDGAERVRQIVSDLKAFSRPESNEPELLDLVQVVEASVNLLGSALSQYTRIERDFAPVPPVRASKAYLAHVLTHVLHHVAYVQGGLERDAHIRVSTKADADGQALVEIRDSTGKIGSTWGDAALSPSPGTRNVESWPSPLAFGRMNLHVCQKILRDYQGEVRFRPDAQGGSIIQLVLPAARP